jgi:CMP-N,N'-diacetyllegionaminic acid synthase
MTSAPDILTVITARGGSKGVPRKNARILAGKPLVAWTIEAALAARAGQRIVVSTDDAAIAALSRDCGAEVPFLRPEPLAGDTASSESAVLHAVQWLAEREDYRPGLILLLQPTSPFRCGGDIDRAVQLQRESDADAVVSVCPNERPIQWLREIDQQGMLADARLGAALKRRQDAAQLYQLNGAIYLIKTEVLVREGTFYPERTRAYIMPAERSLDIDTELDFLIAEHLMTHRRRGEEGP